MTLFLKGDNLDIQTGRFYSPQHIHFICVIKENDVEIDYYQIYHMSAKQQGFQIADLKTYVQSYGKPNEMKAYQSVAVSLGIQALAILLIHANLGLLGWTIHSLNCVRLFIQLHDMAHFSFFSDMSMNIYLGKLIGVYVHFPFNAWRDGHNHHHKHFGNLDRFDASQTILFTKKQFEAMSLPKKILVRIFREPIVFFLFSAPYFWFVGLFYTVAKRYGVFSWTFLEKTMSVVLYTWIFPLFGIPAWKMWVSIIVAEIIGTILFHLQHSVNTPYRQRQTNWDFAKAAVEGSTYLQIPIFLRPFTNGIEYHHIHHLNTNVASYIIDQCHYKFDSLSKDNRNWDNFHINRVGTVLALKSLMNVMLDEEKNVLVPFDYPFL